MPKFKDVVLPKMHNVTELEAVSVEEDVREEERIDAEGEKYTVSFLIREDVEYRVPNSVVTQVQELMESENLKTFKVISTGTGMKTRYSIKILE